jgi:hypothetical protein
MTTTYKGREIAVTPSPYTAGTFQFEYSGLVLVTAGLGEYESEEEALEAARAEIESDEQTGIR